MRRLSVHADHEKGIRLRRPLLFILDFDHTLFDTTAFLDAAAVAASWFGIGRTLFFRTFESVTDGRGDAPYSFQAHVGELPGLSTVERNRLLSTMERVLERSRQFLYFDTLRTLRKLKKWDLNVHLLTFADQKMRRRQIVAAQLEPFFHQLNIVDGSREAKLETLAKLAQTHRHVVVVDDHPKILNYAVSTIPHAIPIRIRRRIVRRYVRLEPPLEGVPTFRSLDEMYPFLVPILRSFRRPA